MQLLLNYILYNDRKTASIIPQSLDNCPQLAGLLDLATDPKSPDQS